MLATVLSSFALLTPQLGPQCATQRAAVRMHHNGVPHELPGDTRRAMIGGSRWLSAAPMSHFNVAQQTYKGLRANTDVGNPHDSSRPLVKVGPVSIGSWSCTAGGWQSPNPRPSTETFLVLSGACTTQILLRSS